MPRAPIPSLDGITALIVTSANAIRTFCTLSDRRDITVYAVGDATALAAGQAGFDRIESAHGDAAALEQFIIRHVDPAEGTLLHIRGRNVTGDLEKSLSAEGYAVRSAVLYDAVASNEFSARARQHLADRNLDAILFFSPRTMKTFVRLAEQAGLADRCDTIVAICISSAVAEAGSALTWRSVEIAAVPDGEAMLQLFESVQESRKT